MNNFGAETVDHADRAGPVCIEQRRLLVHDRKIFIDQQTLVNDIYFKITNPQSVIAEFEFIRRSNNRRVALRFKIFAEQLELLLGRHAPEIDDGNLRRAIWFATEKLFITIDQDFQHQRPPFEAANVVRLRKTLHHRKPFKDLVGGVGVGNSGRALAIQFDEAVRLIC